MFPDIFVDMLTFVASRNRYFLSNKKKSLKCVRLQLHTHKCVHNVGNRQYSDNTGHTVILS